MRHKCNNHQEKKNNQKQNDKKEIGKQKQRQMSYVYSLKTFSTGHLFTESYCYGTWYYGTLQNNIQLNVLVPES